MGNVEISQEDFSEGGELTMEGGIGVGISVFGFTTVFGRQHTSWEEPVDFPASIVPSCVVSCGQLDPGQLYPPCPIHSSVENAFAPLP